MKKTKKETIITVTDQYKVYYDGQNYIIECIDHDPLKPLPWYHTLDDVHEALYYMGFLESRTEKLSV